MAYISTYLDPAAGMEVMFWHDIRALFIDAAYVRHNSRTLDFLKDTYGNTLFPLRVAALHRAVMEIVVDTPLNPLVAHVKRKVVTPPAPRPAPPTARHRRPPPATPHIVSRPPVLLAVQQAPRPTARNTMGRIALHINLALLQERGEGEQKDFLKALECYLKAVHKGHAYAQFAVGKLYFDGKDTAQDSHSLGVVQDYTKAMEWFTMAADLGDADAQNEIGVLYTRGHGVSQDYNKALEWLTKAAKQGHSAAQANIGMLSIQERLQALLTRTYELHQRPIPRLFVILPKKTSEWNPTSLLNSQFKLHFLCECCEHTKVPSGDNTNIPQHIHIANHEGYDLQRPTEFFRKYGRYMLTLLEMIKYGSTIAGYVVPALSSVNVSGAIDMLTNSQDTVSTSVINQSIDYLQIFLSEQDAVKNSSPDLFAVQGTLESVDLCHLGDFIQSKDQDPALGNLYRTITEEGHVKWVCIDHYSSAYKEQDQQALVAAVEVSGGHYNPHLSRVTVRLLSKTQAAGFFTALAKTRRVDELDITFDWEITMSDLETFGVILEKAAVAPRQEGVEKLGKKRLERLAEAVKTNSTLTTLDLYGNSIRAHGAVALSKALTTNSTLATLNLNSNAIGDNGAVALSEALKINSTLTTLHLKFNSIGEKGAVALSEALKSNSTLTTLDLHFNFIGKNGAAALSEAFKTNSCLTTLDLSGIKIENHGAVALSVALKTNSTLATLKLSNNAIKDNGAVALSKALKTNSTLITLDLLLNFIGDNGAVALSEALKTNSTLTTLNLDYNSIGNKGAVALSE
ncbi:hypothetical protein BGX24_010795, partial [Mortierella sp. AD032]